MPSAKFEWIYVGEGGVPTSARLFLHRSSKRRESTEFAWCAQSSTGCNPLGVSVKARDERIRHADSIVSLFGAAPSFHMPSNLFLSFHLFYKPPPVSVRFTGENHENVQKFIAPCSPHFKESCLRCSFP